LATRSTDEVLKGLVEAARRGDPDAPGQLVNATWHSTYTLAYRLTGNEQDALDVTQEAYLRALRALPRFRGEARFSTWLYRVTANCASDQVARSRRSSHDPLDADGAGVPDIADRRAEHDPEASAAAGDEREVLTQALLRLPWRLRQVVVLRDVYDLSHKSIAAELGTSEAATKVRLQRARKRLRDDLVLHWQEVGQPAKRRRTVLAKKVRLADEPGPARNPTVRVDDDAVAS